MKFGRQLNNVLAVACLLFVMSCRTVLSQGPTISDLPYDVVHKSQCLDVYLTSSDKPTPAMIYIHGGGWRAGSKKRVPEWLKVFVADGQLSVIAVEYRFTSVATHPAQVTDCMRAVQFVRHNAKAWKIDPERIGVTGGSAGGHLSAYVALHDDVAITDSNDVVQRYSSRVTCAVSFAGPTDWSLLGTIEHGHPAYRQLLGYTPDTPVSRMKAELLRDVSPISFASRDDPPIMQIHGDHDDVVPLQHASNLHSRLESLGVNSELVVIPGGKHAVAGAGGMHAKRATEFVRKQLIDR